MSLLTPVGAIRVFVDYHPVACELCRIKTADEKADCRYRLIIRFTPDDDGQHLIMCCFRANQEITVNTDIQTAKSPGSKRPERMRSLSIS